MHTLKQHLFFGQIELHPLPDFSFLLYVRQGKDSCNYVLKSWNRELTGCLIFIFIFVKAILLFFPHPSLQRRGAKIKCTHRKNICQPDLCSHHRVCLERESWLPHVTAIAHETCLGVCFVPVEFHSCKCLCVFNWMYPRALYGIPVQLVPVSLALEVHTGCHVYQGNCFNAWYL